MNISFFLGALLLVDGVFGVDVKVSVMEGDSVTLNPHTEIPEDDSAEWWFGGKPIAIKQAAGLFSISEGDKVGFKDRLNVDKHNGSLTITNIRTEDTGNYKLQILGRTETEEIFSVTVTGNMTTVSVKEGESITLDTGLVEIKGYDLIMWKFKNQLIAEINKVTNNFLKYDTSDERFNSRLQRHPQTGSLIISNSRNTDSGDYHLNMISSSHTVQRNISVTVKGVFAVDVKVSLSVMEGDSVTLKPHTVIPEDASAEWWFGDKIIAQMNKAAGLFSTSEGDDVGFKDRLNVDTQTGSLNITNIRTKDTGNYKLQIRSKAEPKDEIFSVTVRDAVESVLVTEGETVTLHTGVTGIQRDDQIQWKFGDQVLNGDHTIRNIRRDQSGYYELEINTTSMILHRKLQITISGGMKTVSVKEGESITLDTGLSNTHGYDLIILKFEDHLIAEINKGPFGFVTHDTSADGRFKDRLSTPPNTASLSISNSRISDSGDYHLNMSSSSYTVQRNISVTVSGVFGDDVKVSVMEGDSVTLKHHTVIPEDASADWWFGDEIIAIKETYGLFSTSEGDKVGFKDRLNLDTQTGSLTITNIRTKDTGDYKLQIRSRTETKDEIFSVTVTDASGVDADGVKSVSVMKGDTVALFAGVTEIQKNDQVQMFGAGTLIAELNGRVDSRWSDYIRVDGRTGKLNIINSQSDQSGDYTVAINTSSWSLHRKFRINITDNVMSVSGKEGHSVTLQTGVTNIQRDDLIEWKFEGQVIPIPRLNGPVVKEWSNVHLNDQTGELTISNIRNYQYGDYEVNTSSMILHKKFHITVVSDKQTPDPGVSPGVVGGIVAVLLVVFAAVLAAVVIYYRRKISKLKRPKKDVAEKNGTNESLNKTELEANSDNL